MHTGMLWFDNSTATLAAKVKRAAEYYEKKYGCKPDLCLVNPSALKEEKLEGLTVVVRPYRPVLPGHIWIGLNYGPVKESETS